MADLTGRKRQTNGQKSRVSLLKFPLKDKEAGSGGLNQKAKISPEQKLGKLLSRES